MTSNSILESFQFTHNRVKTKLCDLSRIINTMATESQDFFEKHKFYSHEYAVETMKFN